MGRWQTGRQLSTVLAGVPPHVSQHRRGAAQRAGGCAGAWPRYVAGNGKPRRILEVGPGTGVVTDEIIAQHGAGRHARSRRAERPVRRRACASGCQRRCVANASPSGFASTTCRSSNLPADQPYDAIVSGLPLNNFPVEVVRSRSSTTSRSSAAPGGTLSFFEYVARAEVQSRWSPAATSAIAWRASTTRLHDACRQAAVRSRLRAVPTCRQRGCIISISVIE